MATGRAFTPEQKRDKALQEKGIKMDAPIRNESDRPKKTRDRTAFNGTSQKLGVVHAIEGKHLHWVNDYPGRVYEAEMGGYEFVSPSEVGLNNTVTPANTDLGGDRVRKLVGKGDDGNALYAYLMKIDLDWYHENQSELQNRVDKVDEAIRAGEIGSVERAYNANQTKLSKS